MTNMMILLLFSCSAVSNSLQPHELQCTRLPCPSLFPRVGSNTWPLSQWCDPIDCRTPGFPVLHYLPELAQTHVHWVSDAIQPSSSVIPFSFNFSQHQGLFQWVGSSHQVTKVLALQLQHQSFQWIFRTDFLQDWLVWSLRSPRDSQESSPTPHFKSINPLALSLLYGPTLTSIHNYWKNHSLD